MVIAKHALKELGQLFSSYKEIYQGRKEDYFPLLYLTRRFNRSAEEIINQVAFDDDYGINAYYLDRESRNLYLYCIKWTEDHNEFKEPLERMVEGGMERIFGYSGWSSGLSSFINSVRADLHRAQDAIRRIYIQFVFNGSVEDARYSDGLAERKEILEGKRYLIDRYFDDREVDLIVEFISDERETPAAPPVERHTVSFTDRVFIETSDREKKLHLGFISLMDLYQIYQKLGQKFLSRNIRAGLSADNPPNRKIRAALEGIVFKHQSPELFSFNHNGVTIAAESVEFEDGAAIISVPRLLNGAQTLTSISKFMDDHGEKLTSNNGKRSIEEIRVIAKIVEYAPQSDFVTNVTICNNQQNPVEAWNLRANDRIQCDLQDKFREEAGIFYSRQENSFQNLSTEDLLDLGIDETKDIKIKQLAQTFLAVQGEIDKMSRLSDVFESQKIYDDTFRESYLRSDVRKIILAYKVNLVLKSPMEVLVEKASQKLNAAINRSRNLVWALLVQALLNEPHLPGLLDQFGNGLTKEGDFREQLKKLASTRILPILKDALSDEGYEQKMLEEKYGFLRTREFFKRCMNIAKERYDWDKKSY